MDVNNRFKVWGQRRRILLTPNSEIDLLTVNKNCFCSKHSHKKKINKFVVIKGKVKIESEYGAVVLKDNESFEIRPPLIHRFYALEDSIMIELAYVEKGKIDPNDINRISQGGRIVNGKEMTLVEMRKKGLLDLK